MKRKPIRLLGVAIVALAAIGWYRVYSPHMESWDVEEVNIEPPKLDLLDDDRLEDKQPAFDPDLVDSRPYGDWNVNSSGAVLKLDVKETRSDEAHLDQLHGSFAQAAASFSDRNILPSINLVDAKAKRFDDGLMAAVTLSMLAESNGMLLAVIKGIREQAAAGGKAHQWASQALFLGGYLERSELRAEALASAERHAVSGSAKPLGVFTWNEKLKRAWALIKFLQKPLDRDVGRELRDLMGPGTELMRAYLKVVKFIEVLSNPLREPGFLAAEHKAFLPPVGTKEDALYDRLFGQTGVPRGVNLMQQFVVAIKLGKVDLSPRSNGGWYDHQTFALESFVLPETGTERQKLLLTKKYKQRLLEAFRAIITTRRETHLGWGQPLFARSEMPMTVRPRLRVEPNPTYFLRMARCYSYLQSALEPGLLERLHGLRETQEREQSLRNELDEMRLLFYGLHLISCEDIGMHPQFGGNELSRRDRAEKLALHFLENWRDSKDMQADTRVCVPVLRQPDRINFRTWCRLGVKAVKLRCEYVRGPRIRNAAEGGNWQEVTAEHNSWLKTKPQDYLILVDEFVEVETRTLRDRTEFRGVCERFGRRDEIVEALSD